MIKKFFILILSIFLLSFFSTNISAQELEPETSQDFTNSYQKVIVIINQVRGQECCDEGSTDSLRQQVSAIKSNGLKGNFAVRYDALIDPNFSNILSNLDQTQFEIGAFLEITPQLASDAGVIYSGETKEWYKAQNAYTVGYSIDDRKKILDQYMERFRFVFGEYPKFSTAWIMDTDSVNYLRDEYGISTHQITREQWGTDSYTLSGGPVHYPYFANQNWLFTKSDTQSFLDEGGKSQTLVLRQTGADPLLNYGDDTNSYTTQPNDYFLGSRGTDYFLRLRDTLLDQTQNNFGFLLLGLENSMAQIFQDEFVKQLESINSEKNSQFTTFKVSDFAEYYNQVSESVVGVEGKDLVGSTNNRSFWVNSEKYRARFLYKDNNLYLSDLRLFNEELADPYNQYVSQDLAFWVAPYVFNASQHYLIEDESSLSYTKNFKEKILHELRKKVLPEFQETNFEAKTSQNDTRTSFDGLMIAENLSRLDGFKRNGEKLFLSFLNEAQEEQHILFENDYIETNFKLGKQDLVATESDFLTQNSVRGGFEIKFIDPNDQSNYLSANILCQDKNCKISFDQPDNNAFTLLRENLYPYFFPEIKNRILSNLKSVFYAHNKYAVVGKNSVRLVFIPRDEKGFATDYEENPDIEVKPIVSGVALHDRQANGTTFIDFFNDQPGKHQVFFKLGNKIDKQLDVYFAPNCKTNKQYCLTHPIQATWYIKAMFYAKLRGF